MQNEVVNPFPHNVVGFGRHHFAKLLKFCGLQGWPTGLRQEHDTDNLPLDDAQLCPRFPTLNLAMHMHRFVLIAVEEDNKAKIFVELGHESGDSVQQTGDGAKLKAGNRRRGTGDGAAAVSWRASEEFLGSASFNFQLWQRGSPRRLEGTKTGNRSQGTGARLRRVSAFRRLGHARGALSLCLPLKSSALEFLVVINQTAKVVAVPLGYSAAGGSHFFDGLIFKHIALLEVQAV